MLYFNRLEDNMPKTRVLVSVDPEKLPRYKELAKQEDRTLSSLIRYLLNRRLEDYHAAAS